MTEIIPKEKIWKALAIGTLVGFCGVGLIDLIHAIISSIVNDGSYFSTTVLIGFCYILIGSPLAFIACFSIGIPLYLIVNRSFDMNLKTSITMGIFMGMIFGLVNFIFFFTAWPIWISVLDLFSTILVGGLAGYVSFSTTKTDDKTTAETA